MKNIPNIKLFLQKNAKFSSAGAPPPDLRRLGALPPDPRTRASGSSASRPTK